MLKPNPRMIILVAAAGLAGCSAPVDLGSVLSKAKAAATSKEASPAASTAPAATRAALVSPERAEVRRLTAQPGQIEASQTTEVRAKLSGYVRSLAVDIGDRVKAGQTLAELDVPELDAELQEKQALVAQAEADRRQAEAQVQVAEAAVVSAAAKLESAQTGVRRTEADLARWQAEYRRTDQLRREGAVTQGLVDETRSKLESAQAARDEMQAQVKSEAAARSQADAERDKARADVVSASARVGVAQAEARRVEAMTRYAKITAPFDGVVTRRNYDPGHLTMPGAAGTPLFVVAAVDPVTVAVGVPEADAPSVNPGDHAQIRVPALEGKQFEGVVERTAWLLDAGTRTLRVEINLPNPADQLRPGLYAYASIAAEVHPNAWTVPATAVVREGNKAYCVVVVDGRAQRRPIEVGIIEGKRVEVLSGLDGGERVVEANAAGLVDGQPVEEDAAKPKS